MTVDPPHDDDSEGAETADRSHDLSGASDDTATPAPADDAGQEPTPDAESNSERDDLDAELERKRPPQPLQDELNEVQPPSSALRSATAQESGADSTAEPADPAPTTRDDRAAQTDDGEQDPTVAGLDELQPVATELRPATAQPSADASATEPANTDSQTEDTADTGCDRSEQTDEEDEV